MLSYEVWTMDFLGQDKQVLCCSNKVASALTSVSNWFLLTIGLDISSRDPQDQIEGYMQKCISKHILELFKNTPETAENFELVQSLWAVTKSLVSGINLNPIAGSMNEFEPTLEYQFFDILKIPLFHASDFNEQVSSALSLQLEKNAVGILYVNKEFRTVFEHNGKVYTLIEERNLHRSRPEAHWTTVVGQRERFISSDFSYLPTGINEILHNCSFVRCGGSFCSKINYERHCGTHQASSSNMIYSRSNLGEYWDEVSVEEARCILSDGDKAVKEAHGISVDEMLKCFVRDPEFPSASKELKCAVKKINDFKKAAKPSSADLLDILTVASEGTSISTNLLEVTMPYVEVDIHDHKIRSMLACFSFSVEQSLAKRWHHHKMEQINAAMEQLLMEEEAKKTSLKELSKDYGSAQAFDHKNDASIASTKSESDEVQVSDDEDVVEDKNRKLLPSDISHLPRLDGEEYFPDFVANKRLARIFKLFYQEQVVALTRVGRKTAKRLLKYILKTHKSGLCWNGDWDILDIRVQKNGSSLVINKSTETATKDGMVLDLQKFIVVLRPYFKLEGIIEPAYFDAFHMDAMSLPDLDSEKFDLFQKFMSDHLAFMPPLARSDLLDKLFRVCDDIARVHGPYLYEPLFYEDGHGWTKVHRYPLSDPFRKVFFHAFGQYSDNFWDLLRFARNFLNHALEYTWVNGIQMITDIAALDLMLEKDLGSQISKMLLALLYGIEAQHQERFVSTWIAYKTSDDEEEDNDEQA